MHLLIRTLLFALLAATPARCRSAALLNPRSVPRAAGEARSFAPRGWKVEGRTEGDLNGDRLPDLALRLIEDRPAERPDGTWNERNRALVVAFRTPRGTFTRAAVAPRLLYCSTCGGVLSDPAGGNLDVTIKNGVLVVSQLSGSREATEVTQRFRWDRTARRFRLIGEDLDTYDRLEGSGTKVSTNFLTGVRLTEKRGVRKRGGEPVPLSTRRTRVNARKRYLEAIVYGER